MDFKSEVHPITTVSSGRGDIRPRGEAVDDASSTEIDGYDHERMKDRSLLTYAEEKKLLRRVDWRLMPLCAIIFMIKNIDANNVRWTNNTWGHLDGTEFHDRLQTLVS
jgi:hypothetical protein